MGVSEFNDGSVHLWNSGAEGFILFNLLQSLQLPTETATNISTTITNVVE